MNSRAWTCFLLSAWNVLGTQKYLNLSLHYYLFMYSLSWKSLYKLLTTFPLSLSCPLFFTFVLRTFFYFLPFCLLFHTLSTVTLKWYIFLASMAYFLDVLNSWSI